MTKDPLVPVYTASGETIFVPASTAQAHGSNSGGGPVSQEQMDNIATDRAAQIEQALADAQAAAAEADKQ
jgi:enamine deaminase RidA (YjgF/YER057c/UK114 family)